MPPVDPPAPAPAPSDAPTRAAERRIVIGYVPVDRREGFAALLALDDALAGIVRTTREPIVGQMRLTWWYEAIEAIDTGTTPIGQPVLIAVADHARPHGVTGAALATMIDGWEALLDPDPLDSAGLEAFASARGGTMFAALGRMLGEPDDARLAPAGKGWALADLATHLRDPAQAALARAIAADALDGLFAHRWPRPLRAIGMLALLARDGLTLPPPRVGSPRRLARLLMHRIWGC